LCSWDPAPVGCWEESSRFNLELPVKNTEPISQSFEIHFSHLLAPMTAVTTSVLCASVASSAEWGWW
jgi:hypothetical protein